jgi:hypothetical protein
MNIVDASLDLLDLIGAELRQGRRQCLWVCGNVIGAVVSAPVFLVDDCRASANCTRGVGRSRWHGVTSYIAAVWKKLHGSLPPPAALRV